MKGTVNASRRQINIEHPHHLLYGSCSKNKSLPLHLMFFYQQHNKSVPSSGVQNVNLGHSFQILPVWNLQPENLPCSAGSWSIKQTALHFSSPHLPHTCRTNPWNPKHTFSTSRNSPSELLGVQPTALQLHQTRAKNQQKCSVQGEKNHCIDL